MLRKAQKCLNFRHLALIFNDLGENKNGGGGGNRTPVRKRRNKTIYVRSHYVISRLTQDITANRKPAQPDYSLLPAEQADRQESALF
jgi:hypothetical protein